MITWENYEEYMMMHADGELRPAEEQELMAFLFDHPELQSELAAFSMAKLIPDTTLVFADKKELLRLVNKKKITLPPWRWYAVAAGVAAILFLSFFKLATDTGENTPAIVTKATKNPPATTPVIKPDTETAPPVAVAATVKKDTSKDRQVSGLSHVSVQRNAAAVANPSADSATASFPAIEPAHPIVIRAVTKAFDFPTPGSKNESEIFSPEIVTNLPAIAIHIQEEDETEGRSFLDRLPINDLKKKGMENVATALASGYDKVNAMREELIESTITVKVEKRKLVISF